MEMGVIGELAGPAVALGGLVFTYFSRRSDRAAEHERSIEDRDRMREIRQSERDEARDARLFDHVRAAYLDLLDVVLTMAAIVERRLPVADYGQEPPPWPSEERLRGVSIAAGAVGSDEVEQAMNRVMEAWWSFHEAADALSAAIDASVADIAPFRQAVEATRQEFRLAYTALQARVRVELRS